MKLNDIYIAICTVKLVKVINSIWSPYDQFYTIITCIDTHNLLRGVLKRRHLAVHEGLKQMFTSYPICQFYIFFPLPFGPSAHLHRKMESLHFLWLCCTTQIIRTVLPKILNTYSHSDEIKLTVLTCNLCYRDPQTRWEVSFPSAFVHMYGS